MKSLLFLFTLILLISGCGKVEMTTQNSTTKEPETVSTPSSSKKELRITVSATKVQAGEHITVSAEEDEDILIYEWWAELGTLKSNGAKTEWTAPAQAGTYNLVLSTTDKLGDTRYQGVNITVDASKSEPTPPSTVLSSQPFSTIKALLSSSNSITYICVGDSTRAESHYGGEYLFYELQDKLRPYNVTSYLLARAGHEARQFANASTYPTWRDAVDRIPQNGENSIVDISLGINDFWNIGDSGIKQDIRSAISSIRSQRPQTHFMLTMPNRVYNNESMTNTLKSIYQALSNELHIPLNNVVDGVMPSQSSTPYSWYKNDGFNVHMSQTGQHLVAQYILGNILP